jgi:N-acetyl-gamma-glutamyl-phosphate reductase
MKAGVVGASGYAGTEIVRLLGTHPGFELVVATGNRHEGERIADHTPSLAALVGNLTYAESSLDVLDGLDLVFLALPHGASQALVPGLLDSVGTVIDLGADFRLDPVTYEAWYGQEHEAPHLCEQAVYGLVERNRSALAGARLVAVPGCYPTAATLGLAPFRDADLIETTGVIVDAASGVSGAGRANGDHLHFSHVDESFAAYGLLDHRHTAEMEVNLTCSVLFTPHLAPMVRGMLVTAYARPNGTVTTRDAMTLLHDAYDAEPFVTVVDTPPQTKWCTGSNAAFVTARVDERTGTLLVLSAIDNLGKGAAGQAVQCANVVTGQEETTGLARAGMYP